MKYWTKRFKHPVITKNILSDEIYGPVATHYLRVSHWTSSHSAQSPVDEINKGTGEIFTIQYDNNDIVHRNFISSAFREMLESSISIVVGGVLNVHNFSTQLHSSELI